MVSDKSMWIFEDISTPEEGARNIPSTAVIESNFEDAVKKYCSHSNIEFDNASTGVIREFTATSNSGFVHLIVVGKAIWDGTDPVTGKVFITSNEEFGFSDFIVGESVEDAFEDFLIDYQANLLQSRVYPDLSAKGENEVLFSIAQEQGEGMITQFITTLWDCEIIGG